MRLLDYPESVLARIRRLRFDRMIEQHEGPEDWASFLKYYPLETVQIEGKDVLLPIALEQHPNITIRRCKVGAGGDVLTIFLKDTTHVRDPQDELFMAGFLAVCERLPDTQLFVVVVYHEWFIVPFIRDGGERLDRD